MKINFVSATLPVIGVLVALYAPSHLAWWIFIAGVISGFLLMFRRKRNVILRLGGITWTEQELCRHVLITGDTGSGKTTSGFHQILFQLTMNVPDWGGLVLGVKGDEHYFVSELLAAAGRNSHHIHIEVRSDEYSTKWMPPHRFNLLSDRSIPWMTHAKAIVDIAASMTEGRQSSFFRPMAQISLSNAFSMLDALNLPVTLTRAYEILTSHLSCKNAVMRLKSTPGEHSALIDFFESTFLEARASEQREAVEGTIKTYLGFFLDRDIANIFSSDEPDTFSFDEIDHGAVITISMPQRYVSERRYVQTYLKILFYLHALRRFDKAKAQRTDENLLLLVADEFQDLVTASEDGISDHKVVDRIRAAGAAIIAGTQSELSVEPVIGQAKREVLALNMRSRLIFRAADLKGATESSNFIGKKEIWKSTKTSKPFGESTTSQRQEEVFIVKPTQLMRLKDHTAVVVHPSKKFRKLTIVPVTGAGKPYSWFRR